MMSTESANSFTLIGEASDSMENLSRRLKVVSVSTTFISADWLTQKRPCGTITASVEFVSVCLLRPGDQ